MDTPAPGGTGAAGELPLDARCAAVAARQGMHTHIVAISSRMRRPLLKRERRRDIPDDAKPRCPPTRQIRPMLLMLTCGIHNADASWNIARGRSGLQRWGHPALQ